MTTYTTPLDVLEFPRLSMYTAAPGVERERSSLGWSLLNSNPRCTVWTRVDDKEKGPIQAGIGVEALQAIYDEAMRIFSNETVVDTFVADTAKRDEQSNNFEKVVTSTLALGRGDDGLCFIGLKSSDPSRPEIIFQFKGYEYHPFRRKSGAISESEMSSIHARAYMHALKSALLENPRGQTQEERKAAAERRKAARDAKGKGGGSYQQRPQAASAAPKFGDSDFLDTVSF